MKTPPHTRCQRWSGWWHGKPPATACRSGARRDRWRTRPWPVGKRGGRISSSASSARGRRARAWWAP
eukprot:13991061-Alexandrium_andersonii.AAC.1